MSEPIYAFSMREQLKVFTLRRAALMPRRGWKIGINVPEVQRALGLEHALVGFLDGDRVFESDAVLSCPAGTDLRIEPELCIVMREGVAPSATAAMAREAIQEVRPALELVNYAKPMRGLDDIVSHSMFHYGVVLGPAYPVPSPDEVKSVALDLALDVNGRIVRASRQDLVPLDLAELPVLVARLLEPFGETLQAGDLLMSGAFLERALPLAPGQHARASFGKLGEVGARLTD